MILKQTTQPISLELVADLLAESQGASESRDHTRWHVSNLLRSAELIAKGEYRYYTFEGEPLGIMSLGRIWESVADLLLRNYASSGDGIYTPNVVLEDSGIVASLDGVMTLKSDTGYESIVVESKLRFTASMEVPFQHLQQTACYCHLLGTTIVMMPRLHVISKPPVASAEIVFLELDGEFVDNTWELVLKTKAILEERGITPKEQQQCLKK